MHNFFSSILLLSLFVVGCNKDSDDGVSNTPTPELNDTIAEPCPFLDERMCEDGYMNEYFVGVDSVLVDFENYSEKLLLESFTGFRCSNAPPATETALNLKSQNPDRLTIVNVHCTSVFAQPITTDTTQPFHTDFRTLEGEEFVVYHILPSLPYGSINRLGTEFNSYIAFSDWSERVDNLLSENNPEVYISIENISVDEDNETITASVYVKPLVSTGEDYFINISVTEDGILEGQKDNNTSGGIIYDYVHKHVYRGSSFGSWGIEVYEGDLLLRSNEVLSFELTMDINPVWNLENCELLVFISKSSNREVVQVEETHLL